MAPEALPVEEDRQQNTLKSKFALACAIMVTLAAIVAVFMM